MKRDSFQMFRFWYALTREGYVSRMNARPFHESDMYVFREKGKEPTPLTSPVVILSLGRYVRSGLDYSKLEHAGYCRYLEGSKKPVLNMSINDPKLRSLAEKYCELQR